MSRGAREQSVPARRLARWLIAIVVTAAYPLVAFHPYEWRSPLRVNHAAWLPDGVLRFDAPGIATTEAPPSWLDVVRRTHELDITLRVRPLYTSQSGPARIFTVSRDPYSRNLTLGQEHDRLVVRLRTPDRTPNGLPAWEVPHVFTEGQAWRDLSVTVSPGRLHVTVDGETRVDERLIDAPLTAFRSDHRLALGNELTGDRPWLGDIARATVSVGDLQVDYVQPLRLQLPPRIRSFHNRPHLVPFRPLEIGDAVLNFLGFIPFGVLVGWLVLERRRQMTAWAITPVLLLSLGIEAGQWAMPARYPSITDVLLNTLGGAVGLAASRLRHRGGATSAAMPGGTARLG